LQVRVAYNPEKIGRIRLGAVGMLRRSRRA
jgi:hypothetical protein